MITLHFYLTTMFSAGRMDLKDTDNKKQTHGIRRPFGVAGLYANLLTVFLLCVMVK